MIKNEYRTLLAEAERLLTDSTNHAIRDRAELRDSVCAYLASERKKGVSLATILDSVEAIMIRADNRTGDLHGHRKFAHEMIDWCVELDRRASARIV